MNELTPWIIFNKHHCRGDRFCGYISKLDGDIGLFVSLDGDIDGIVHLGDLDWVIAAEDAIQRYRVDDLVETVILKIEPERQRVSLGIKQLKPNPRKDSDGEPPAPPLPVGPKLPGGPELGATAAILDRTSRLRPSHQL